MPKPRHPTLTIWNSRNLKRVAIFSEFEILYQFIKSWVLYQFSNFPTLSFNSDSLPQWDILFQFWLNHFYIFPVLISFQCSFQQPNTTYICHVKVNEFWDSYWKLKTKRKSKGYPEAISLCCSANAQQNAILCLQEAADINVCSH